MLAGALVGLAVVLGAAGSPHPLTAQPAMDDDMVPRQWLQDRTTVEEAEASHTATADERSKRFPDLAMPFGRLSHKWQAMKARMQPGDELWTFMSPPASWQALAGRMGIALVRQGRVIDAIVTIMN